MNSYPYWRSNRFLLYGFLVTACLLLNMGSFLSSSYFSNPVIVLGGILIFFFLTSFFGVILVTIYFNQTYINESLWNSGYHNEVKVSDITVLGNTLKSFSINGGKHKYDLLSPANFRVVVKNEYENIIHFHLIHTPDESDQNIMVIFEPGSWIVPPSVRAYLHS